MTLSPNRRLARALASHVGPAVQALIPQPGVMASRASRTISGLAVPWNTYGNTTAGRIAFAPGSIRLPADLSQVKLVDTHARPPESVGYATAATDDGQGLRMTFQLDSSKRATKVLKAAAERSKDGLSVEVDDLNIDTAALVHDSLLTAVASVPIPAFASARVAEVAAAHQEGNTMDPNQAPATQAPATQAPAPTQAPAQAPAPGPSAQAPAQAPAAQAQLHQLQVPEGYTLVANQAPHAQAPASPAQAPAMLHAHAQGVGDGAQGVTPDDGQMFAALQRVMTGERLTPELAAALSDIVNTDIYETVGQESYVGRLWSGRAYQRRFVPLMRSGNLTSWKVRGWKWGVKPAVADYAGDKADVPSNAPTVLPAETEAARLAGGHDLDRKFRDFGDTEFLAAYLEAMTESYAKQSDIKAYTFLNASATNGDDTASGGTLLDAFLLATGQVEDLTDGEPAGWVIANRGDVRDLMSVTNNEAPAYLSQLGFSWDKLVATNLHPAGTVIAGTQAASTFYELPGSPIRVEAVDIARGGIDEALFGYYATLLHSASGIVKSTITA